MSDLKTHYVSGEPDTTGREPFEDSGRTGSLGTGPNTQHLSGGIGSGQGLQSGAAASSGLDGQDYQNVAPGSAHAHGHHGHHHGYGHSHDNSGLSATQSSDYASGNTGSSGAGAGAGTAVGSAVGTGASEAIGGEHHGHGHGHHHHSKPSGEGYGGVGAAGTGDHVDRVGPQGQGQAAYERTTGDGPQTRGAAGTDRFDTGSTGAAHGSAENQDTSQRAPGQKSGGISGVLGTSDKDFTGRERQGGTMGAYADSDGPIEGNTSGPKGNTALTGREGNLDENPVAQAKSREAGTTTSSHADTTAKNDGEHKGLMDKVKDVFKS